MVSTCGPYDLDGATTPPTPRNLLARFEGIQLPLGPLAIIDGLDPRAPSVVAPSPPYLLHVASTSHLLDEVGWHRGAHHNSSRHDGPNSIDRLCKPSVEGMCLEATTSPDREASTASGAVLAPQTKQPDPSIDGRSGNVPPKTNQLPGVGAGAAK
jgi:hypothetical protein